MTSHQVRYEGPSALAMDVATRLADAPGIDLTSAERKEPTGGPVDTVRLVLTVEATTAAVTAAVASVRAELPEEASLTVEEDLAGS